MNTNTLDISIDLRTISDGGMVTVRFTMGGHKFVEVLELSAALEMLRERAR